MSDNRKSFTPINMLTSGGNGDIGCATPFGYVTAMYQGGEIVCVTVDGDRFVPESLHGAEPVAYAAVNGANAESIAGLFQTEELAELGAQRIGGDVRPLVYGDTHPQPAQQGGVPEGWLAEFARRMDEQLEKAHDMSGFGPIILHIAQEVIADTLQPEGDGWIKCSDRLPTEADADEYGEVWAHDKGMTHPRYKVSRWKWDSLKEIADLTHWKPTGLQRPQPPKQEGE